MALKYKNEFENTFNTWLKSHKFDIETELATDFAYCDSEEKIYMGLFIVDGVEGVWKKQLEKWGCKNYYGVFTTCFLHELGHYHTLYYFNNTEMFFDKFLKRLLNLIPNLSFRNYLYFNLPVEKVATQWAIDYMNEHPIITKRLSIMAENEIKEFLEQNEVEMEGEF